MTEALDNFNTAAENVRQKMKAMEEHGKIYVLQPEEIDVLKEFRKFKSLIKRPATFKFLTRPIEKDVTSDKDTR